MKNNFRYYICFLIIIALMPSVKAQEKSVPIFKNGEAQIVPAFKDAEKWIRHDLWVETEFDTDGDGKFDRMHVGVTRPYQTDSENLKLPIIYISSPYFAGVSGFVEGLFWDIKHEIGENRKGTCTSGSNS